MFFLIYLVVSYITIYKLLGYFFDPKLDYLENISFKETETYYLNLNEYDEEEGKDILDYYINSEYNSMSWEYWTFGAGIRE